MIVWWIIHIHEHEYFARSAVSQLQSLTLNDSGFTRYSRDMLMTLVNARRSEHVPVLDFSNLRTLSVHIFYDSGFSGFLALLKVTKKLETLSYNQEHVVESFIQFYMAVTRPRGFIQDDTGAALRTWGIRDGNSCHQYIGDVPLRPSLSLVFQNIQTRSHISLPHRFQN